MISLATAARSGSDERTLEHNQSAKRPELFPQILAEFYPHPREGRCAPSAVPADAKRKKRKNRLRCVVTKKAVNHG